MKVALILAMGFAAIGFAGDVPTKSRLKATTVDVLRINGGSGILVSAALVTDSETGREWLVVSGVANTHVHVSEVRK